MGGLAVVWQKVRWSVAQRGVSGTLRAMAKRAGASNEPGREAVRHPFDTRHGVDTSGLIGGGSLGVGHAHDAYITGYAGVAPSRFERAIGQWLETRPQGTPEGWTFVDLGCGKGRAVMLASAMGFGEAIGVELNPELARVASANLETWMSGGQARCAARVICGDATEFPLPPGPCLVYLFNPFGAPVLRRLLEGLERQGSGRAGSLAVVYQNAEQESVFEEFPSFRRLWSKVIPLSEEDAAVDPVASASDRCNLYLRDAAS